MTSLRLLKSAPAFAGMTIVEGDAGTDVFYSRSGMSPRAGHEHALRFRSAPLPNPRRYTVTRLVRVTASMCKRIALYGALLAVTALLLQWLDYQRLARTRWDEIYAVGIALAFLALGIFTGARTFAGAHARPAFDGNPKALAALGISARELAVLHELVAGRSNKEIATRLHIAPSTVKTHVARLYEKLGAKRRTDAVNRARELGLVP